MERYGFIRDKFEIKFLVLFAMSHLSAPAEFDDISEMTLCDDAIDYFEYAECVAELVKSGHIEQDGVLYSITPLGLGAAELFEKNIARSVRLKAAERAKAVNERLRRALMVHAEVSEPGDVYIARMGLDDNVGSVMKLELTCASSGEAEKLKSLFTKNAERIYNSILKAILESGAE